jgi:hypothetical protein
LLALPGLTARAVGAVGNIFCDLWLPSIFFKTSASGAAFFVLKFIFFSVCFSYVYSTIYDFFFGLNCRIFYILSATVCFIIACRLPAFSHYMVVSWVLAEVVFLFSAAGCGVAFSSRFCVYRFRWFCNVLFAAVVFFLASVEAAFIDAALIR